MGGKKSEWADRVTSSSQAHLIGHTPNGDSPGQTGGKRGGGAQQLHFIIHQNTMVQNRKKHGINSH